MVQAVFGVRYGLSSLHFRVKGVNLALELVACGIAYLAAALVIGRATRGS